MSVWEEQTSQPARPIRAMSNQMGSRLKPRAILTESIQAFKARMPGAETEIKR